jgi:hypothetical protein
MRTVRGRRKQRTGTKGAKATIKGDALIEPDDGIEVQVVSGFVQHQQCGLHEQCPGGGAVEYRVRGERTLLSKPPGSTGRQSLTA